MWRSRTYLFFLALLLCPYSHASGTEGYWTYAYEDFDVTTDRGGDRAVALAHHIARFDKAVSRILQLADTRLPTHIYELPEDQAKQLFGREGAAGFNFTGYEVTVVAQSGALREKPNWGPLFGYMGSLLLDGRGLRYPHWFLIGVPLLFAETEFDGFQIKTGGIALGAARALAGSLIPMRTFLSLHSDDPQLKDANYRALYEAESWYLAYEIYVQRKFQPEFKQYLELTSGGKSDAEAFAASFKITYEDLDKFLVIAKRDPARLFIVPIPLEPPDPSAPQRLSAAEGEARLAELNLLWQRRPEALRLVTLALQLNSQNEAALRVLARVSVQDAHFEVALNAVDKLMAATTPSVAALTDSGEVLSRLAQAVTRKQHSIGVDTDILARRAKEAFERALSLDGEFLRAWAGLANLYTSRGSVDAAMTLVPRVEPVMAKHPKNAALARALASMCAQTGQNDRALLFGEYWRSSAVSQKDLDHAVAFISRLKAPPPSTPGS
jgi:tetratricopeptide (TPR) repeat protein